MQVLREDQARAAVTSKHAYSVHVAAHTDCALILAIAMIAEEMGREKDLHLMSRAGSH